MLDSTTTVSSLNLLISQYETRIKQLEAENSVLRNEMVKAGIKIPLSEYTGAILSPLPTTPTVVTPQVLVPTTSSGVTTSGTTLISTTNSTTISTITSTYGKDVAGFITRINTDWKSIKDFYKMDASARIAGYEFVQSGALDHVFVDIVFGTGAT
jgi:hypothetical protein